MSWDYQSALAFLADEKREIHLQLDRMEALLSELDHPERGLRCIHIAGTNGKGSILAYLTSALSHSGARVGSYSSPVVYYYREQFRVNGSPIDEDSFTSLAGRIRRAVESLERQGVDRPSSFELETCLAFLYFREMNCDIAVVECGMGGRDDATNAIPPPEAVVFASIGMDHEKYLGGTIEEITAVKAGIIKPGSGAVITGPQSCTDILEKACQKAGVSLHLWRKEDILRTQLAPDATEVVYRGVTLRSPLVGAAQIPNLITAYETLKVLQSRGFPITDDQILAGLFRTQWQGRMMRILDAPTFYVDGAHNPAAARMLAQTLREIFPGAAWIFIVGVFRDKDVRSMIREMSGLAEQVFTVAAPGNARAMPPEELAALWQEAGERASACSSPAEAVKRALAEAGTGKKILAFGSLAYLAEVERALAAVHRIGDGPR